MIWEILKIEATKDKRAITRAYREQLTQVNPEEKPEEFMALREAYEEALRLADMEDQPEAEQEEKTELDLWRDQLEAVYFDISKRRNTECWEELFDQDICQRLDTKGEVEEAMLVFFMENYKVPHEVWLVIDKHFDLYERLGELSEKYPELFVKYVIKLGLEREDVVPYELFSPDSDGRAVDEYMNLFICAGIASTIFLGGWAPFVIPGLDGFNEIMMMIPGAIWFLGKVFFVIMLLLWERWTFPRLRIDQILTLEWKYLVPMTMVLLVLMALCVSFGLTF